MISPEIEWRRQPKESRTFLALLAVGVVCVMLWAARTGRQVTEVDVWASRAGIEGRAGSRPVVEHPVSARRHLRPPRSWQQERAALLSDVREVSCRVDQYTGVVARRQQDLADDPADEWEVERCGSVRQQLAGLEREEARVQRLLESAQGLEEFRVAAQQTGRLRAQADAVQGLVRAVQWRHGGQGYVAAKPGP